MTESYHDTHAIHDNDPQRPDALRRKDTTASCSWLSATMIR